MPSVKVVIVDLLDCLFKLSSTSEGVESPNLILVFSSDDCP